MSQPATISRPRRRMFVGLLLWALPSMAIPQPTMLPEVFSARLQAQLSKVGAIGPATLVAACKNAQPISDVKLVVSFSSEAHLPRGTATTFQGFPIASRVPYGRYLVLAAAVVTRHRLVEIATAPGVVRIDVDCPLRLEVPPVYPRALTTDCDPSQSSLREPPDDPAYLDGRQSGLLAIRAPDAWRADRTASKALVAVMDTDINIRNPDLTCGLWANKAEVGGGAGYDDDGNGLIDDEHGFDFVDMDPDPSDCREGCGSHGTHVAGTILATGNNGVGTVGVVWRGDYIPIRIVPPETEVKIDTSRLAGAIWYALKNGASIINMSFHWDEDADVLRDALKGALPGNTTPRGALIVTALGDIGRDIEEQKRYPVLYAKENDFPNVVVVAAYSDKMDPYPFTNFFPKVDVIAAPGVDVFSLARMPAAACANGSSSSAAFVSGAAALTWSDERYAACTAVEIKSLLLETGAQVEKCIPGDPPVCIGKQVTFLSLGFLQDEKTVIDCTGH